MKDSVKMTKSEIILHKAQQISDNLQDAWASANLIGETIKKVDFKGTDMIFTFESGVRMIVSSIADNTGKPHLDFTIGCRKVAI